MTKFSIIGGLILLVGVFLNAFAQQPDLVINEFKEPSWKWGDQTLGFDISNTTDMVKFVVTEVDIEFPDSRTGCHRQFLSSGYIEPGAHTLLETDFFVPGNYGEARVTVVLHDVVDTLDALFPGQDFHREEIAFTVVRPESMLEWRDYRIELPPRIEEHPYFDSEFSRVLLALIDRGVSVERMAEMAGTSVLFVNGQIVPMVTHGLMTQTADGYRLNFPIIGVDESREAVRLAETAAGSLAPIIAANLQRYPAFLDSLTRSGLVEPTNILGGTSVLERLYPMVGGLLLWFDLGDRFVDSGVTMAPFVASDICNALSHRYMYAAPAGEGYNGNHLYAYLGEVKSYKIVFADNPVEVDCSRSYSFVGRPGTQRSWQWGDDLRPDFFIVDTLAIRPALDFLASGCETVLAAAAGSLDDLGGRFGHGQNMRGVRYWFWNIVATRCLETLVANGALKDDGKGLYEFSAMRGKL
ncbi:MAG: hypothetical protein JSW34_12365 [Candidatus Zixiibacteriota bacterium]|nr:MAG: hypothetical protein JSW34_12365 [candidate division Zixibacteria bacterium]